MCGSCFWDKKAGIIKHIDNDEIDLAIEKLDDYISESLRQTRPIFKKNCECGADKLNSTHYQWCPKFKEYGK